MARIFLTYPPSATATWYGEKNLSELAELGELVLRSTEDDLTQQDVLELSKGCDIIISDKPTAGSEALFRENKNLVAFLRCAMDVKSIDIEAASKHGVLVTRAGPGFVQAVSEWIIGQMINLARNLPSYYAAYQQGHIPPQRMGRQLAGSTAGIIGFGNIGRAVAPTLKSLGIRVLAHDPYSAAAAHEADRVDLDTLLKNADYVICLAIYNEETDGMADEHFFNRMKDGSCFINASRGGLVQEEALARALACGKLAGAALDVGRGYDDHPTLALAARPEVLATPHIGGMVPQAITYQAGQTVQQARAILSGHMPEGAVNPGNAYRMKNIRS